jgi:hypothetical protein
MDDVAVWIDSNVAFDPSKVRRLAELAQQKGVRLLVHAQVHLEICRQQRVKHGAKFSPTLIDSFLDTLGIQVAEARLDRGAAERWAELLYQRYPTSDKWKAAKLLAVKAKLPESTSLPARRVPMTTDWLIALEVEHRAAVVVVEDQGEEWSTLRSKAPCCALSFEEALRWLSERPDIGGDAAPGRTS